VPAVTVPIFSNRNTVCKEGNKLRIHDVILKVQDMQQRFHFRVIFLPPADGLLIIAQKTPSGDSKE
jgi:hypothetical protein